MQFGGVAVIAVAVGSGLFVAACTFDLADVVEPATAVGGSSTTSGGGGGAGATSGGGAAAGGSDCGASDAGAPAVEFAEPTLADLVASDYNADDPAFTGDLLELYFNSDLEGLPHKIFRSLRVCPTDRWGTPAEVSELSNDLSSTTPALSPDGLTMFLAYSLDTATKQFDIYVTTRPSRDAVWSTPTVVAELSSPETDRPNWVSVDLLTIGIDSVRSGDNDLFVATRSTMEAAWEPPVAVDTLNTAEYEGDAWLSPDRLTTYFLKVVTGQAGEIYRATRADPQSKWNAPEPVSELNTTANESDPWLSPDGRYVMFTRRLDGKDRLYEAFR